MYLERCLYETINPSDIDAIQKEKDEVVVLEKKKQGQLREIKELEMKREGKIEIFLSWYSIQ